MPFPGESVLAVLADVNAYSSWWPPPFRFRVDDDSPSGVGARVRISNGYLLSWVATIETLEPDRIRMRYTGKAIEGEARWSVRAVLGGTALVHRVDVDVRSFWLRVLTGRFDVRKRHTRQMKRVFDALEARLTALGIPRVPEPVPPRPRPPTVRG